MITLFKVLLDVIKLWFELQNNKLYFDLAEKFDNSLDRLDKKRTLLRSKPDSLSQKLADDVMLEILEEQKKKQLFLDEWRTKLKI